MKQVQDKCTSTSVIRLIKEIFSEQGIPGKVIPVTMAHILRAKSTKISVINGDLNMSRLEALGELFQKHWAS